MDTHGNTRKPDRVCTTSLRRKLANHEGAGWGAGAGLCGISAVFSVGSGIGEVAVWVTLFPTADADHHPTPIVSEVENISVFR